MKLILRNLTKRFDERVIVENLSFEFAERGVYHITGESGAGKTTLLNMIAGLDTDYLGQILGGGKENVSFVFQEYRLFDGASAIENALISIDTPTNEEIKKAEEYFIRLGFTNEQIYQKAKYLSGGMKQRVAIIRALMKNAPILILDEPTKELHSELVNELYKILNEIQDQRLVLLVSHDSVPKEYRKADFFNNSGK